MIDRVALMHHPFLNKRQSTRMADLTPYILASVMLTNNIVCFESPMLPPYNQQVPSFGAELLAMYFFKTVSLQASRAVIMGLQSLVPFFGSPE